jgi:rhodanese-related sulfurtransferase
LIAQITPAELAAWQGDAERAAPLLVDVREPWEHAICHIDGSRLVPLSTVPARLADLPRDQDLVFVCHHGNRSQRVAAWLEQNGYSRLYNLVGGVERWATDVDPSMARY